MIIHSAILGIIQGLTEFLPVSSSAHLILIPMLLGWKQMGLEFDVALHLGSTIAVISYFHKEVWGMIKGFLSLFTKNRSEENKKNGRLSLLILLSMIPAGIAVVFIKKYIEHLRENFTIIAAMLIIVGILLFLSDKFKNLKLEVNDLTPKMAFIIGIAQACALMPGVSRSGATIILALFLGLKRDEAAKFSFLMAIPVILGGALLSAKDLIEVGITADFAMNIFVGTLFSAVSGFFCIKYFLNFLKSGGFKVFAIYRVIFGLFLFYYFYKFVG